MRRKLIVPAVAVLCLIAVAVLIFTLYPRSRKENGVALLNFETGDKLSGYMVADRTGQELDIAQIPGEHKLIIFAWDKCGDCIAEYDSYRLLFPLFSTDELNIAFVWDNNIPKDPIGLSYTAQDRYKFTDWVPSYFLVDGNGTILLKETDLGVVVDYLSEHFPSNPEALASLFPGQELLVGVDRCGSCKTAFDELAASGKSFRYILEGEVTSGAYEGDVRVYRDPHSIVSAALGIDSYPENLG